MFYWAMPLTRALFDTLTSIDEANLVLEAYLRRKQALLLCLSMHSNSLTSKSGVHASFITSFLWI